MVFIVVQANRKCQPEKKRAAGPILEGVPTHCSSRLLGAYRRMWYA